MFKPDWDRLSWLHYDYKVYDFLQELAKIDRALCKINADLNDLETRKQAIRDILDEVQVQGQ